MLLYHVISYSSQHDAVPLRKSGEQDYRFRIQRGPGNLQGMKGMSVHVVLRYSWYSSPKKLTNRFSSSVSNASV